MRWTVGALTGAAVLLFAAGCDTASDSPDAAPPATAPTGQPGGGAGAPSGPPADQPKNVNVAAALGTANKEFALLAKGDWAGAWALWTDATKKQVPREVFVATNRECPAALKRQYQLQNVVPVSNQLVELTFRSGDTVRHGALRPARTGWLFEPGGDMLVEYASGADAAIAKRKSAGKC
jgi:hypothetical protein